MKAFYTAHFAVALLAALGLSALAGTADRRPWRRLVALAGGAGALLVLAPLVPRLVPAATAAFAAGFFPPGFAADARAALLARVLGDAALGGAVALAVAGVAALALRPALAAPRAAGMVVGPHRRRPAPDRGRSQPDGDGRPSSGRRPSSRRASRPSGTAASSAAVSRRARAYLAARLARRTEHEAWSFALLLETLTPAFNVPLGVPTALSPDLTMLVPADRVFSPAEASCRDLDAILPRLREAAVRFVLSVDPLAHPELEPDGVLAPERVAPLAVHVYRLRDPAPAPRPSAPRASSRPSSARTASSWSSSRTDRRRWCCATAGPRAGRRASTDVPPRFARAESTARCRSPPAAAGWRWPTGPRVSRRRSPRAGSASRWRPPGAPAEAPRRRPRAGRAARLTARRARRLPSPVHGDAKPNLAIVAIIPARFASTRLPGKPLADIHGKTLVERVYERARAASTVGPGGRRHRRRAHRDRRARLRRRGGDDLARPRDRHRPARRGRAVDRGRRDRQRAGRRADARPRRDRRRGEGARSTSPRSRWRPSRCPCAAPRRCWPRPW